MSPEWVNHQTTIAIAVPERAIISVEKMEMVEMLGDLHEAGKRSGMFAPFAEPASTNRARRQILNRVSQPIILDDGSRGRMMSVAEAQHIFNGELFNTGLEISPDGLFDTPGTTESGEFLADAVAGAAIAEFKRLGGAGNFSERDPFTIVYIGDGNGVTRSRVAKEIKNKEPDLYRVLKNVVVDAGSGMLSQQQERITGVPEEYIHASLLHMPQIADRQIRGLVYIFEVLDDAIDPRLVLSSPSEIKLMEHMLFWPGNSFIANPLPEYVQLPFNDEVIRKLIDAWGYRSMARLYQTGIPVSAFLPMAIRESRRILQSGAVMVGDYAGIFGSRVAMDNPDYYPVRWITPAHLRQASSVDFVKYLGQVNLTTDVDPYAVRTAGEWFGFKPIFTGISAHVLSEVSPYIYDSRYVSEIISWRWHCSLQMMPQDHWEEREFTRESLDPHGYQPSGWFRDRYAEVQRARKEFRALDFFNPNYWTILLRV